MTPPTARRRDDAAAVRFGLAKADDDAEIRRLLRENPTPGRISVSLEREPDARMAAAVEGDVAHTIVARAPYENRPIAMGSVSVRGRYLNGEPQRVGYLGQLRLDRACRPRASVILGGYARFAELHRSLGVKLYLTSIASDNIVARRLLERGLPGMPSYRPLETFLTSLIPVLSRRGRTPSGPRVEPAPPERLADVVACLRRGGRRCHFAPVWNESELLKWIETGELQLACVTRGGRVAGCIGRWDQSAYKQTVVRGYDPHLARFRHVVNLARRLTGTPYLPPVGTPLDLIYLSHLAVDDDDPATFDALLAHACQPSDAVPHRSRATFVLGLSASHPLLPRVPNRVRRYAYRTTLYAVHWDDGRAAAEALDRRPCQPEVALL